MTQNGRERGVLLRDLVYKAYEDAQTTRRSNSLQYGAIGKPCSRSLWLKLRWADELKRHHGQLLRLFDTGKQQEGRLLADLRRVDVQVYERDPNGEGAQIAASSCDGHSKGFLDAVTGNVPHATNAWVVTECKTHNNKSFTRLEKEGVAQSKPEHFAQMQGYMRDHGIQEGLYQAVNKDNDELYFEFIAFDQAYAASLLAKAHSIIYSDVPPDKINRSPDFYLCKMCDARKVCHMGELPQRNCRTCIEIKPVGASEVEKQTEGAIKTAQWHCRLHNTFRTFAEQLQGCGDHRYNVALVPGKQVSVSPDQQGIRYELRDGRTWEDRGPNGDAIPASAPETAPGA